MSTIVTFLFIVIAILIHMFVYWRALHEDYLSTNIFVSGFYQVVGALIGAALFVFVHTKLSPTAIFKPDQLWFWGAALGFTISMAAIQLRFKFRMNEVVEAATAGLLFALLIIVFSQVILHFAWNLILALIVLVLLITLYYFLKANYRKFSWYQSGKVGFASLATLGVFFLIRAFIAIFFRSDMLSFIGRIDGLISSILAFLVFLRLYTLSQRK